MIKQINGTKKYFISEDGFCFKISGRKEIEIPIQIIRGIPKVKINNEKRNLILLMIEHFVNLKEPIYKTSFTIEENRLPLRNIKIIYIKKYNSKDLDTINLFKYKCVEKAKDNNQRVNYSSTLSPNDVLNCLKRNNFKCFYCNESIQTKLWHLDHVVPISKGGLNDSSNIVCSCKECNLMKGAIDLKDFINKCYKIIKNDSLKKGIEIKKSKIKN